MIILSTNRSSLTSNLLICSSLISLSRFISLVKNWSPEEWRPRVYTLVSLLTLEEALRSTFPGWYFVSNTFVVYKQLCWGLVLSFFRFILECIHKWIHTCSHMYGCMCMNVHAQACRGLQLISSVFSIALHFIYVGRELHWTQSFPVWLA